MPDMQRLTRLFRDKIDAIDPGFAIEITTPAATLTEPLIARQPESRDRGWRWPL
jgi:hypothetical protein